MDSQTPMNSEVTYFAPYTSYSIKLHNKATARIKVGHHYYPERQLDCYII